MKQLWVTGIFALLLYGAAQSQDKREDTWQCNIENTAFKTGEHLVYKVYYQWNMFWMNAGEVTFDVQSAVILDRSCYYVKAEGKTYRSYDWFYKVRDKYETFIDKETMLPLKFFRDVNEGGYTIYEDATFHWEKQEVEHIKNHREPKTFRVPSCTQDVLSAIYASRNIDFNRYKKNDTIPITIFLDQKVYPLYIRHMGKETLKTNLGQFRCIKFRPLLIEGTIFEGGEEMVVWATDDKNKIPVRVESPIIVGEVKADLKSYSGLRHNLSSQLK